MASPIVCGNSRPRCSISSLAAWRNERDGLVLEHSFCTHVGHQARRQGGFLIARKPPFLCNLWVGLSIIIMHMPTKIIAEPRDVCVYPVRLEPSERCVATRATFLAGAREPRPRNALLRGLDYTS